MSDALTAANESIRRLFRSIIDEDAVTIWDGGPLVTRIELASFGSERLLDQGQRRDARRFFSVALGVALALEKQEAA